MESLYEVRKISDLKDMINQSAELFGHKKAFSIKDNNDTFRGITYSEFKNDIDALGTAFIDMGLKDTNIAVIGENRYEWCATYLSVVNGAGVIVPLDKELPLNEIENLLSTSEASAVIFSKKLLEAMKKMKSALSTVKYYICMDNDINEEGFENFEKLIEKGKKLIADGDKRYLDAEIDTEKMSILLFTSGTTGYAKGVMLSHKNICSNIMAVCSTVRFSSDDSTLSILPIHHTYECTCGFLTMIYNGGTISFCEGLKHIGKNIKESSPTILIVVPLLLENMYRKIMDQINKKFITRYAVKGLSAGNTVLKAVGLDMSRKIFKKVHQNLGGKLRLIITGAAGIDPETSEGLMKMGFTVLQGYGLTECSPLVAGNRVYANKPKSVGLPMPGVDVKIVNPDESGIGEIVTRGSNVMMGYFRNEEATEKCLKDEWFYTGDLGYIDKEGFIYITGRVKNVIVTKNGKNIYPEEVESYINKNSVVLESLVWGFYDEDSGETFVHAQIVPNFEKIKEMFNDVLPTKEQINSLIKDAVKAANKNMPLYKQIKDFTIKDSEFVKTTTKKIKRYMEKFEKKDNNSDNTGNSSTM